MLVAGLDGCRAGWTAVLLKDGQFAEAGLFPRAEDVLTRWDDVVVVAIDIPIGLPDASTSYLRAADAAAKAFLGPAGASVFPTLPREVLEAPDFQTALALSRELFGKGISKQSYALAAKILEVDEFAKSERSVHEVHPEVSFRAMPGGPKLYSKKSWNGLMQRKQRLRSQGIEVPEELGQAGGAGPDDVLDAAAAAWSGVRIATGRSRTLPDTALATTGRTIAIHY